MSTVNTGILTGLLQKCGQPYEVELPLLRIFPTSIGWFEILPGERVDNELQVDLSTFDAMDYIGTTFIDLANVIEDIESDNL